MEKKNHNHIQWKLHEKNSLHLFINVALCTTFTAKMGCNSYIFQKIVIYNDYLGMNDNVIR